MPHLKYRPELMGTAELTPSGAFEAGSMASFTLIYTAGRFGIDDLGSIKIAFRSANDQGNLQTDDPSAPGFLTVKASNGAALDYKYELRRNIRPWFKSLYIQVKRGFLREGDTIVVVYGDRSGGSPGFRLQTFCEETFEFKVLVDPFATYDYIELENSPTIAIVPGPPVCWKAVQPTLRRPREEFRLSLKAEDAWGNPSDKIDATVQLRSNVPVRGLPPTVRFRAGGSTAVIEGLSIDEAGDTTIDVLDAGGVLLTRSNPLRVAATEPFRHYWSDLHGQSEETIGTNSARDYFLFARDRSFLDIAGHQGNDFQITSEFWAELNRLTAEFHEPGRFLTVPGYEWSGNTNLGGDHNVWYRSEGRPIYRSSHALVTDVADEATDRHSARELFDTLTQEDAIVTAHVGGRYADVKFAHDGRTEPSVEIHSAWGTFEWIVRDAFAMNYRIGIVASSDGHKGRPGSSYPGASKFGAYGGLTCHLMDELTRDALFESFRRRHHYCTTGARLYLKTGVQLAKAGTVFTRNPELGDADQYSARDAIMGDIVEVVDDDVLFYVNVVGSAAIERIEIRDGLDTIETVRPYSKNDLGSRIRVIWEGAEYRGRGRNVTWDGSARFSGNAIEHFSAINFWNVERPLAQTAGDELRWQSITTGSFAGFDCWLADPNAGTLEMRTPAVQFSIPIGEIGFEDRVWEAGGLEKRVRVFRLPDENRHRAVQIERRVPLRSSGDTRLFVCVTQEDGHKAWSSPIYLFARRR